MCDCERAAELLSARLDGALGEGENAELEGHLAQCADCRAVAEDLSVVHAALPELVEEVPQGFHRRVMEQIAAEKVVAFPVKKKHTAWRSWASLAAVFAVILLGGTTLSRLDILSPPEAGPALADHAEATPAEAGSGPMAAAETGDVLSGGVQNGVGGGSARKDEPEAQNAPQAEGRSASSPPSALPTSAPAATGQPQLQTRMLMPLTPEQAGALVAETMYPGVETTVLRDEEGNYLGFHITLTDESADVTYLGLTPNGAYYEFYVVDFRGEHNYFAAGLDGATVNSMTALGREAYDALVGDGDS